MQGTYRHEFKYTISYAEYLFLRPRLQAVMKKDSHVDEQGFYQIHSIYFDNYSDKALREKVDGVQKREKFRIRWYNKSKMVMTLEKKMKINDLCMKLGVNITEEQFRRILKKDYEWMLQSPNELLQEFYYRVKQQRLLPYVQVSYIREPFVYEMGNVRVTFDSHITSSLARHDWNYDSPQVPATDRPGEIVLEVKYDAYLPSVIADALQLGTIRQNAFSKYSTCRRFG